MPRSFRSSITWRWPSTVLTPNILQLRSETFQVPEADKEKEAVGPNETVAPLLPMGMTLRRAFCHSGLILHVILAPAVTFPVTTGSAVTQAVRDGPLKTLPA